MNNRTTREYKRLRANGWHARQALAHAKTVDTFRDLESDGLVRLRIEPDESMCMDDLKGDTFNRRVNPEIPESRMAREEKEFEEKVSRKGVWGIIGEYRDPVTKEWEQSDSVWGFVGEDWRDSGYDSDIMSATIDALEQAQNAAEPMYAIG